MSALHASVIGLAFLVHLPVVCLAEPAPSATENVIAGISARFYFSFADYLGDADFFNVPLEDEFGAKFFCRARLYDGFTVTADIQVVDPGIPAADVVMVGGLRTMIRF